MHWCLVISCTLTLSSASLFMMDLKERPSKAGVLSRERMLLLRSFFSGAPMLPLPLRLLVPAAGLLERWLRMVKAAERAATTAAGDMC